MIEPDMALALRLFDQLHTLSFDGVGIVRDTYGEGEERAHKLVAETAQELGLEVRRDAALNLYVTLPGRNRDLPVVMTGSHLDSVPRGGNFDGAAGVVAGLAILAGWVQKDVQPERDVTVMGVRAEESAWFPVSYVGSKAAFGLLDDTALATCRLDSGRTLADHIRDRGGDPDAVAIGKAELKPEDIDCFVELHIEQGPVLIEAGHSLGIVTGICGSHRYRHARVLGQYAHSGATPRAYRRDAVVGLAMFIEQAQQAWEALESQGHELTLTFGQVNTDAKQADFSTVAGRVDFSIDMRSRNPATLEKMDGCIHRAVADVEARCGVRFDLGPVTGSQPAVVNDELKGELWVVAQRLGLTPYCLPSGAGHDTATFANQGIPAAMIFVRNANGSHNPDEAMDIGDFIDATRTLEGVLGQRAGLTFCQQRRPVSSVSSCND